MAGRASRTAFVAAWLIAGSPVMAASAELKPASAVDAARLVTADADAGQWLTTGRDANWDYHSTLSDIDASNVSRLGFAWQYALGTQRGLEATPVMVDGVLYFSGNFGRVYAVDAG